MSPSIFLMLRTDLLASRTTKSHIYIRSQTTNHLFQRKYPYLWNLVFLNINLTKMLFKESTQIYQEALQKSGYNRQLTYQKSINNKNEETKQRKRKIICFNPLYSKNVSTKVGNQFLKLINRYFLPQHKFYKLVNKNNVKVSYSYMPNMKNIINPHNKNKINPPKDNIARTCNCIRKHQCPLNEKCPTASHQTKKTQKQNLL